MKNIFSKILLTSIILSQSAAAQIQAEGKAGLVITPTRVEMDGRERSETITIANNGAAKGSYRIHLINKKMDEDGKLTDVGSEDKNGMYADQMLRVSPRSVTIEPGSNQNIRILARKPKDLPDGEYRTHLSVMILPEDEEQQPAATDTQDEKLTIAIKANYGVSIPVIIRHGNVSASGQMSNITYVPAKSGENQYPALKFSINRNGNASLYGDMKIIHVKNNGEESVIKFMGGMAIYTPNQRRNFEIPLEDSAKLAGGKIKVIYQEKEKSGGKIIAQNELKL